MAKKRKKGVPPVLVTIWLNDNKAPVIRVFQEGVN
jgi:hypothetical protein